MFFNHAILANKMQYTSKIKPFIYRAIRFYIRCYKKTNVPGSCLSTGILNVDVVEEQKRRMLRNSNNH